ncbi:MAG: anaerobic ribonucleoside-triphosphate reductase [Bacillaceae bacterium]|nr:anaerobic ribonucleoside-triphosphate reductase [Bacillaceae bacterium]
MSTTLIAITFLYGIKYQLRKKLEIEAPYHMYTPAGHISYVELDGLATDNPKAIEKMVKLAMAKNIGYFSLNHNSTRCMDCGYEGAESNIEECPSCKSSNVDVIQRITGYLVGSVAKWNSGKQAELRDRVRHEK